MECFSKDRLPQMKSSAYQYSFLNEALKSTRFDHYHGHVNQDKEKLKTRTYVSKAKKDG